MRKLRITLKMQWGATSFSFNLELHCYIDNTPNEHTKSSFIIGLLLIIDI